MALDRLTKVDGGGISTTSDYRVGIITASKFVGPFDGTGGNFSGIITATGANFSGNVTIGGTLTYEDVTNIDSVGIITAQSDIHVGAGVSVVGVVTATTFVGNGDFVDLDVDGHTNLDNVSIAGITTGGGFKTAGTSSDAGATNGFTAGRINIYDNNSHNIFRIGTSPSFAPTVWQTSAITFTASSFSVTNTQSTREYININNSTGILKLGYGGAGSTHGFKFETSAKGIQVGTGVTIETNGQATFSGITTFSEGVIIPDNKALSLGNRLVGSTAGDLRLYHDTNNSYIDEIGSGNLYIRNNTNNSIFCQTSGKVELYYNGNDKLATTNTGVSVSGTLVAGALDISGDIDVDGHTNLDNVSIAGVTTFSADVYANEGIFLPDTKALKIGNTEGSPDFTISHDTSNTILDGNTGDIIIRADGDDLKLLAEDDIVLRDNDDSTNFIHCINGGAVELYHNGTKKVETFSQGLLTPNNLGICFGDGGCKVSGTAGSGSSAGIFFMTNSGGKWQIDGNGHFVPSTAGAVNIGSASKEIGNVYLANSKALFLGSNQAGDLYNDGTDTYFRNSASNGQMLIRSDGNILISNYAANEYRIKTFNNGAVELYYDQSAHATAKLATTATGVSVHGEVEASQDFPVIKPVLDFNFAAEKKLDPRFTFYRRGTASYVDKKGIIRYASSNEPRFDHHPTSGASLGFLVEKQQSNYQAYSVDMDQAPYKNEVTVVNDAAISPDGTKNASKIIGGDDSSTSQRLGWSTQNVSNSNYTMWSIWLKSEETSCIIQVYSNTYTFGADHLNVELADGTTGGHNNNDGAFRYNLEKYPNKWWRLSWGGNGAGGAGGMYVAVVPSISSARGATAGAASGKVWYAWGLQEEVSTESRIATSYIPTYGSTATRYGDYAQIQDDDFDDFFDRFQGTVINEHSNALQSYGGGGSGWEFQNNQFQTNLITSTGSGYAHNAYPGCHASVFGDRGSNGSGNGSGNDYVQAFGPNDADAQNAPTNTGNGRYPNNNIADYTRYYRTWIDAMSYDVTPSENILRVATGGASSYVGGNTQNISLANISKLEIGNGASQLGYSNIYGRIKRWVYYDKVLPLSQLRNLTAQLPNSYL